MADDEVVEAMPGEQQTVSRRSFIKEAIAAGNNYLRPTPVTPDMIVSSLNAGKWVDHGPTAHV